MDITHGGKFLPQSPLFPSLRWLRSVADSILGLLTDGFCRLLETNELDADEAGELPRISIVTPVLNAADTVRETIESVLSQDYPDLEYIIIDGGSIDGTLDVVADYRHQITHLVTESDNGMYDALAKGFSRATGEIFAYLNADDLYLPGALERVGCHFQKHCRDHVIYFEDVVEVKGWRFANAPQPKVTHGMLSNGHVLYQDGVFFSRQAYESVGGFNTSVRLAGDWDLWVRLAECYPFRRLHGHVSCFRIRHGQLSQDREAYDEERCELRKRHPVGRPGIAVRFHGLIHRTKDLMDSMRSRRLLYPIPFHQMPPPQGRSPPRTWRAPRCPLTGSYPSRLLFSSMDTRFGDREVHHIYLNREETLAQCYPPLTQERLNELHGVHYSERNPAPLAPGAEVPAPYRDFRGGSPLARLVRRILLPHRLCHQLHVSWDDNTANELLELASERHRPDDDKVRFLDVGCFEGSLLKELRKLTRWSLAGVEANEKAAHKARRSDFEVWTATAEDAIYGIPGGKRFDLIFLGQTVEHLIEPQVAIRRLRLLLSPVGEIVLSTPNLESWQLELFGPTWSHWHPPYHRHVFSLRALRHLAQAAELRLQCYRTFSHPYWSALSLELNRAGFGGHVPHGIEFPESTMRKAESLAAWAKLFWNWRGKGDYLYVTMARG